MSARRRGSKASAVQADLDRLDELLGTLLQPLLLGGHDIVDLQRWATLRLWISSAKEGDWLQDLDLMDIGVRYLSDLTTPQGGKSPHDDC